MKSPTTEPSRERSAFTAHVCGRVQGVGFRWSAIREAERCGVVGWVRNEPDGSVSCRCEGVQAGLERYLAWLRRGPPGAWVERVDVAWESWTGAYQAFSVRY